MTHSASPRAQCGLTLASSVSDTRDVVVPTPPTRPRLTFVLACHPRPSSSSSSLSSPAICKSPLASNPADVSPAPWCAPQVCATIAPVNHASYTSGSTHRPPFLARTHVFRWTFSCKRTYSLLFRMFLPSFLYLRPVATFFSSLPLRPCYRTQTLAAPFDLAPTVALRHLTHSLPFIWTPDSFRIRRRALRRWQNSLSVLTLVSLSPLSLHSVQCIATNSDSINTQALPC